MPQTKEKNANRSEKKQNNTKIEKKKTKDIVLDSKTEKIEEDSTLEKTIKDERESRDTRIGNFLKKLFLIITSPIWFPWKVLFIKKPGNKFADITGTKKLFRALRAPITKTLKFIVYVCIITLEILVVYKIRYSILTYPITKKSVQNYYLNSEDKPEEYKESLKRAFDHIDDWDLAAKNKMYVIFDSDIVKDAFLYTSDDTLQYVVEKFNDDETFREDLEYTATNIEQIAARAIKEIPDSLEIEEINVALKPIANVGSVAVDYRAALDVLGAFGDFILIEEDMKAGGIDMTDEEIDRSLEMFTNFARGMSLEEAYYKAERK